MGHRQTSHSKRFILRTSKYELFWWSIIQVCNKYLGIPLYITDDIVVHNIIWYAIYKMPLLVVWELSTTSSVAVLAKHTYTIVLGMLCKHLLEYLQFYWWIHSSWHNSLEIMLRHSWCEAKFTSLMKVFSSFYKVS